MVRRRAAVGEILTGVGAAALGAVDRAVDGDDGLTDQVLELQGLHQIGIPDQTAVGDPQIGALFVNRREPPDAGLQAFSGPVDGRVFLCGHLHLEPQVGSRDRPRGVADSVEAGEMRIGPLGLQFTLGCAGLEGLAAVQPDGPTEDDQVDQ